MPKRGGYALVGAGLLISCRALLSIDDVSPGDPFGADGGEGGAASNGSPICSKDGFCWVNPLPQGNSLASVYARSERDVWAVGDVGTVIHFDGSWSGAAREASDTYAAITGAEGVLYVAGSRKGTPLLLSSTDGTTWTTLTGPDAGAPTGTTFTSLWYDGTSTLWLATDDGSILTLAKGDKTLALKQKLPSAVSALSGTRGDAVFAVGSEGLAQRYRYADDAWTAVSLPTPPDLRAVATIGGTTYMGGEGVLFEVTTGGVKIAAVTPALTATVVFHAIAEGEGGRVLAAGRDGTSGVLYERDAAGAWSRVLTGSSGLEVGASFRGVARAGNEAWAVGEGGAMARRAVGGAWAPAFTRRRFGKAVATLPVSGSPTEVLVAGDKGVVRFGGNATALEGATGSISGAAAVGSAPWLATSEGLFRREATSWPAVTPALPFKPATTLAAAGPADVFVAGRTAARADAPVAAARLQAGSWRSVTVPVGLEGAVPVASWSEGGGTYWLALNRCEGTQCQPLLFTQEGTASTLVSRQDVLGGAAAGSVYAVWGASADEIYVGGLVTLQSTNKSANLITTGTTGTQVLLPRGVTATDSPVLAVQGASGDVWAGGAPRNVWHKAGGTWETRESGAALPVSALFVRAPGDVWIAADQDVVLHRSP